MAEESPWHCPRCGEKGSGQNYCPKCGWPTELIEEYNITIKMRAGKTGGFSEMEQETLKTAITSLFSGASSGQGWAIVESVEVEKVEKTGAKTRDFESQTGWRRHL